ncbi:hypothetical protein K440DRAFT_622190, partial [Wilcoxina mikolae CBS 423.85]
GTSRPRHNGTHDCGAPPPFVARRAGSSHSSTSKVTLLPQLPPLLLLARPPLTIGDAFHGSEQQPCAIAKAYDECHENLIAS